jgi:hypothetical protein
MQKPAIMEQVLFVNEWQTLNHAFQPQRLFFRADKCGSQQNDRQL